MPYVAPEEAFDLPLLDLDRLALEAGPPPWRLCLVGTPGLRVVLICWPAGFASIPHRHPHAEESFVIVRGHAAFTIGASGVLEAGPGDFLIAPRDVEHQIRVTGEEPLTLLATVAPNEDRPDETIELT